MPQPKSYLTSDLIDEFLYTMLKGKGFSIDIDDYVVAAQIVEEIKDKAVDADRVKFALAAIICRNADEQKHFYHLFDAFIQEKEDQQKQKLLEEEKITKAITKQKWLKIKRFIIIAFPVVFILLVVLFFFVPISKTDYLPNENIKIERLFNDQHFTIADPLDFSLHDVFLPETKFNIKQTLFQKYFDAHVDSANIKATWNLQDTLIKNKPVINYAFKKPGKKKINVTISNPNGTFRVFQDSILVCDQLPVIKNDDPVYKGENTEFKVENPQNRSLVWKVDGKEVMGKNDGLQYRFDSAKVYQVSCRYRDQFCPHDSFGQLEVNVIERNQFSVLNSQTGNVTPEVTQQLRKLFYWLFGVIGFFLICMVLTYFIPSLYKVYENAQFGVFKKIYEGKETHYLKNVELPDFGGKQPPLDISFHNKNKLIGGKEPIIKLAFDLKRKIESDQYYLNLKKTSLATIRNLGMFTPVLQNKSSKRNYLVLIDKTNEKSIEVKLFQYLVNQLSANLVDLDVYYYHKNPLQVFKKHIDDAININYLKNQYHQSILIVFGNGHNFLDPNFPEMDAAVENSFSLWPSRLLITPKPASDWSLEEKTLATFFHVLPADHVGLLNAVEALLKRAYQPVKDLNVLKKYSSKFVEFEDLEEVEEYLGHENILQWLAAMALYPKITWEIILSIGDVLGDNLVTYENLLKICRIDWVQKGVFPSRIRLELLKRLKIEHEITARETIIQLLEEDAEVEADSFSNNEKNLQLIINKFVLYSHNPKRYATYETAEKEFLKLYNQEKLRDIPLNVYLKGIDPDKKEDAWENTLQSKNNKVDNLKLYSNQKLGVVSDETIKNKIKKNLFQTLILFSVLFTSLTIVGFVKPNFSMLVDTKSQIIKDWSILFEKDSCYKMFNPSRLIVEMNDHKIIDVVIDDKDSISFNNLEQVKGQELSFTFVSASGTDASALMKITGRQVKLRILGACSKPEALNSAVYLRYYPEKMKDSMALFQKKLMNAKYLVNESLDRELTTKSEIRYTLDADKDRAMSISIEASLFFGQDIKVVKAKSTLENQIEVWVVGGKEQATPIYLQYYPESFKEQASSLMRGLKAQGYAVAFGLDKKTSQKSEVRYYNEKDKAVAASLAKVATKYLDQNITTVMVQKNKRNQIEIWLKGQEQSPNKEPNVQQKSEPEKGGQDFECKSFASGDTTTIYLKSIDSEALNNVINQLKKNARAKAILYGYSIDSDGEKGDLNFAEGIKNYIMNASGLADNRFVVRSRLKDTPKGSCGSKCLIFIQETNTKSKM